ncbi:hypothetical protein FQA39_LY03334 [Lamprigera yunnana]|nr:hypothetical protein FQA39_LY03334 [Lamprigera yunnana]
MAFYMALTYTDKELHKRALAVLPKTKLELAAQNRLRAIQEQVKKGKMEDPNISINDLLLLELLSWFKNEFFTWVDSPDCRFCSGTTTFYNMSNDPKLMVYTQRVEMHKCTNCQLLTPFPRYNNVYILLLTRSGRCGEWANTFTLICCALGWDARLVVDQGDHVWTEVFSTTQNRWVHCDPCENAYDTPLIYESGWGKQLTYVIAYSADEVQDVTWRYTSQHNVVLARRNRCTENELVEALLKLRSERQQNFSSSKKEYLTKRILNELIELMIEKKPKESDQQGRISGSEGWRVARGEVRLPSSSWVLKKCDTELGNIAVRYCTALDKYEYIAHNKVEAKEGWQNGIFSGKNIFRKEEKDWKMVYLCRTEGSNDGHVSWKFKVESTKQVINVVEVIFCHKLYENGKIHISMQNENTVVNMPHTTEHFRSSALNGSKEVTITAHLSGGIGDVGWQHAQLFRQSLFSKEYLFSITLSFKSVN